MRVLALAVLCAAAPTLAQELSVPPGGLVRWPGAATRCTRDGVEVAPVNGECLFAVDLQRAPGPMLLGREHDGRAETARVTVTPAPYPVERLTVDERYVNPSPKELARAERERRVLLKVFARRTRPRFALPLSHPLAAAPAGRNFGRERILNGEPRAPHSGIDYPAEPGEPVLAAADGVVALAARHFFPGNIVVVDHGGGLFTAYLHLSKILVRPGDAVTRGERIGLAGATGRVSGPHLHFGVRWQDARVDPQLVLRPVAELPAVP